MARKTRKRRPPLDRAKLDDLALAYVARFATSKGKLRNYLVRKIRERDWEGDGDPPIDEIIGKLSSYGYVDDEGYALAKARDLGARGYGERRVKSALMAAGIDEKEGGAAMRQAAEDKVSSAIRLARRRKIGPFAIEEADRQQREKWIAAMVRAGHGFDLARKICELPPGEEPGDDLLLS